MLDGSNLDWNMIPSYVTDVRMNLVPGVTTEMVQDDYRNGSGQEWLRKFRAIHSSAALAANSFGRWKREPGKLKIIGCTGFSSPKLESQCHTGLGGTPPNLDVLLESPTVVIGIESKLLEPLKLIKPLFSASYTLENLPLCEKAWWDALTQTKRMPPCHLDVAQLIKHYLGLRKVYPNGRQVYLVYLFWKPVNADSIPEYARHAEELKDFENLVAEGKEVSFIAMDYLRLCESWSIDRDMGSHAESLQNRYRVEI